MNAHELDLQYAQDVYKLIRWYNSGLAIKLPLITSTTQINEGKGRAFYCDIDNNGNSKFVACIRNETRLAGSYCHKKSLWISFTDDRFFHTGCNYESSLSDGQILLYNDVYSESEYFQNSLLYTPDVNRDLLLVSYIKSRFSDLKDIQMMDINVQYLDEMIKICKHDLTFIKYKEIVGE